MTLEHATIPTPWYEYLCELFEKHKAMTPAEVDKSFTEIWLQLKLRRFHENKEHDHLLLTCSDINQKEEVVKILESRCAYPAFEIIQGIPGFDSELEVRIRKI